MGTDTYITYTNGFWTVSKDTLHKWVDILIDKKIDFTVCTRSDFSKTYTEKPVYIVITNATREASKKLIDECGFTNRWPA